MHARLLPGCILPAERINVRGQPLQSRHETAHLIAAIARADIADIDKMVSSIDPGHQRPKCRTIAVPAADDDLVSSPAFGLGPVRGATGYIGRVQFLRNDAFK